MSRDTVVGVDVALVNLKDGGTTLVSRGQDVPSTIHGDERRRLTDLGVFRRPSTPTTALSSVDPQLAEVQAQLAATTARLAAAEEALAVAGRVAAEPTLATTAIAVAGASESAEPGTADQTPAAKPDTSVEEPAGNASLDKWQAYATARGAVAADLDGKTRDELRDTFSSK